MSQAQEIMVLAFLSAYSNGSKYVEISMGKDRGNYEIHRVLKEAYPELWTIGISYDHLNCKGLDEGNFLFEHLITVAHASFFENKIFLIHGSLLEYTTNFHHIMLTSNATFFAALGD